MISPGGSREQKTLFCVCCIDGGSWCSTRAGEVTSAGHAASESDYRERKGCVLVCEQRCHRCGAENAGRKLFLQTDTGGSKFWPDRWPCGRRFVHVLLVGPGRSQPSKGNRKDEDLEGRSCCRTPRRSCVLQQGVRRHDRYKRQPDGEIQELRHG